jgi:ribonuclease BN (tRNA processing enzyme)
MPGPRAFRELRLVNGSTGDPALFVDDPGRDNALLIDSGENAALGDDRLGDLEAVFLTHHHVDHFIGFDRIVRANLDRDKALHVYGQEGTIQKTSGFGDIRGAAQGWMNVPLSAESLLGTLLWGLFIVAFSRKVIH